MHRIVCLVLIDAKVGVPLTVRPTNSGTERHDLNFEFLHAARTRGGWHELGCVRDAVTVPRAMPRAFLRSTRG